MLLPKKDAKLIPTEDIEKNPKLSNIRFVDFERSEEARDNFNNEKYAFQCNPEKMMCTTGILSVRGNAESSMHTNVSFSTTVNMEQFLQVVKYDPSNPPRDKDFQYTIMAEYHKKSQAEFKKAKLANRDLYTEYFKEGLRDERGINVPSVNAWMDENAFKDTVFVSLHESQDGVHYGKLYFPRTYMMQSDGQTQTAAVFLLSKDEEAVNELNAYENLRLTLDIELNCDLNMARQSFADRNGRGVKKDKNLVVEMDVSAPLNILRLRATKGTIFENRIVGAGAASISDTSTTGIMNLSTAEQFLVHMIYGTYVRGQSVKHHHVDALLPVASKLFKTMQHCFKDQFPSITAKNDDPFRKKYLTGWGMAQKGIANAFHAANAEEIKPILDAIKADNAKFDFSQLNLTDDEIKLMSPQERFNEILKHYKRTKEYSNTITQDELIHRLKSINWQRHAKHWIDLLGASKDSKTGKYKTWKLRSLDDKAVVKGSRPHNVISIGYVTSAILSDNWKEFTSDSIARG